MTVPEPPKGTFTVLDTRERLKSGGSGWIVSWRRLDLTIAVEPLPTVAVTVRVKFPKVGDPAEILSVVDVPLPASTSVVCDKNAETLNGAPDTVTVAVPVSPLSGNNETCELPWPPCSKVRTFGTMETNRSGLSLLKTPSTEKCETG